MNQEPILASFIGVDLAWSDRNPSGLVHLSFDGQGCGLLVTDHLIFDENILDWIDQRGGKTIWVGIDAPIIAPNSPGTSRPVDKKITALFGRYHAGAYPGNRERCARPIRRTLAAFLPFAEANGGITCAA